MTDEANRGDIAVAKVVARPYLELAREQFLAGKKCWLPWRRHWYFGFSEGLIAAAELIMRHACARSGGDYEQELDAAIRDSMRNVDEIISEAKEELA